MKKLFRYRGSEAMLGGVASGLANYFGIDATIVRVLFAVGFFLPAPVVIMYLILWIVMPARTYEETTVVGSLTENA